MMAMAGVSGDGCWKKQREQQSAAKRLPLICPGTPSTSSGSGGDGDNDTLTETDSQTDSSKGYRLTVDITQSSAFETALQIVELVKRLSAERDAEEQRRQEKMIRCCDDGDDGDDNHDQDHGWPNGRR